MRFESVSTSMASNWKTIDLYSKIPEVACCYVIYFVHEYIGRIVYVGSTKNLSKRISGHRLRPAVLLDDKTKEYSYGITSSKMGVAPYAIVKYRESLEYGDWAMIELKLIKRLKPKFNKTGK